MKLERSALFLSVLVVFSPPAHQRKAWVCLAIFDAQA
jgi:hypothetical protein